MAVIRPRHPRAGFRERVEVTRIWLTRSQTQALVDLAYRGRCNRRNLSAASKALHDPAPREGRLEIDLPDRDRGILEEAADARFRIPGLTEAVQVLLRVLDEAPRVPPKVKRADMSRVAVEPGKRQCIRCGQMKTVATFKMPDGVMCKRCRTYGSLKRDIRVVSGGSPGLGRRR
jgi:hypothetical protein